MERFVFENNTKVCFGEGCVQEHLPSLLRAYGKNVLLGYGGGSIRKTGVYDTVLSILREEGKTVTEFSGIMANPTYEKVLEGIRLVRDHQIHLILAVGGGSVMDCCKAVSMGAVYQGDLWEDFWARKGTVDFDPLPLGVIVTVSGTGSEVNGDAVITNEKEKIKTGRDYIGCNPKFALLDPVYTYSVPRRQMIASGFDILSHIMEVYFSEPQEENVSDDLSEALMRNVIRSLRKAARDPRDRAARSDLMWDAAMAENRIIKLGKRLDFQCHQMEHQLGAYTDCIHGEGLAVLHPVYYRHIYRHGLSQFAKFAQRVWDIPSPGKTQEELARAGIDALENFLRELGLPKTLRELGADERLSLEEIAQSCVLAPGSFKPMTHAEILDIFRECF